MKRNNKIELEKQNEIWITRNRLKQTLRTIAKEIKNGNYEMAYNITKVTHNNV